MYRQARPEAALLVLLLLAAASTAARAQQQAAPTAQAAAQTQAAELLTDQPGCKLPTKSGVIPPGVGPPLAPAAAAATPKASELSCAVSVPALARGQVALYEFSVAPQSEMSLTILMRWRGGDGGAGGGRGGGGTTGGGGGGVKMELLLPRDDGALPAADDPATFEAREERAAPWGGEAALHLSSQRISGNPGRYVLRLTGRGGGTPTAEVTVATPGRATRLDAGDRAALASVAEACCGAAEAGRSSSDALSFCSIAPTALSEAAPWSADLCHVPPNLCTGQGRLVSLSLRAGGLQCRGGGGGLPAGLGRLSALQRLDAGHNAFGGDAAAAAKVLSSLPSLAELYLPDVGLQGAPACALAGPARRALDLADNGLTGALPACLLAGGLEELDVSRNEIAGKLPDADPATSALTVLAAAGQQGSGGGGRGLSGAIPAGLLRLPSLRHLDVSHNGLSGGLARLPPGAQYVGVASNALTGPLPPLPAALAALDVSDNRLSGALPALGAAPGLAAFLAGGNALEGGLKALPEGLAKFNVSHNRLEGPLPLPLPALLRVFDAGGNGRLSGDLGALDLAQFEELWLGNNSFTGQIPASVATARDLRALSLRLNNLSGPIPAEWGTPQLEALLLASNRLTGPIPGALAALPRLGSLQLAANALDGTLDEFAGRLPPGGSAHYSVNFSNNAITGALPQGLARLGVFSTNQALVAAGSGAPLARALDVSNNALDAPFPLWLLSAVPEARLACGCPVAVRLNGPEMRLACPRHRAASALINVTDYQYQVASGGGYRCYDDGGDGDGDGNAAAAAGGGGRSVFLADFLTSPSNGGSGGAAGGADADMPAWLGDSGPRQPPKLSPGASAGVALAALAAAGGLAAVCFAFVYRRWWQERRARRFQAFADVTDDTNAALGGSLGGGGGAVGGGLGRAAVIEVAPWRGAGGGGGGGGLQNQQQI